MAEDLSLPGRLSVRTAMQWANQTNGGFSTASPDALVRPVISSGQFGYQKVNVVDQLRDADSFLNWMERGIRARREPPAIGWGDLRILHVDDDRILAHTCGWQGEMFIAVHNLSADRLTVTIDTEEIEINSLTELFNDQSYGSAESTIKPCHLSPYGYRWFQAAGIMR
jgi:maltose alpha-D-glucosyltransferase / alpha-amylase